MVDAVEQSGRSLTTSRIAAPSRIHLAFPRASHTRDRRRVVATAWALARGLATIFESRPAFQSGIHAHHEPPASFWERDQTAETTARDVPGGPRQDARDV